MCERFQNEKGQVKSLALILSMRKKVEYVLRLTSVWAPSPEISLNIVVRRGFQRISGSSAS
jgi:hypothetical protein